MLINREHLWTGNEDALARDLIIRSCLGCKKNFSLSMILSNKNTESLSEGEELISIEFSLKNSFGLGLFKMNFSSKIEYP